MPYDTGFVFKYDCGEFEGNMTAAAELADRAGFAGRRQESARRGMLRGLGMANPIEVAAGPFTNRARISPSSRYIPTARRRFMQDRCPPDRA